MFSLEDLPYFDLVTKLKYGKVNVVPKMVRKVLSNGQMLRILRKRRQLQWWLRTSQEMAKEIQIGSRTKYNLYRIHLKSKQTPINPWHWTVMTVIMNLHSLSRNLESTRQNRCIWKVTCAELLQGTQKYKTKDDHTRRVNLLWKVRLMLYTRHERWLIVSNVHWRLLSSHSHLYHVERFKTFMDIRGLWIQTFSTELGTEYASKGKGLSQDKRNHSHPDR